MWQFVEVHLIQWTTLYFQTIVISELICRAAKHLFKLYMQGVDMMNTSAAISHFLNCYIGSYPSPHAQVTADEVSPQREYIDKRPFW